MCFDHHFITKLINNDIQGYAIQAFNQSRHVIIFQEYNINRIFSPIAYNICINIDFT